MLKSVSILKRILFVLAGFTVSRPASTTAASPQSVQLDRQALRDRWEGIPDLLTLAREQAKAGDAYALLPKLEAEYRAAKKCFRITTIYRHRETCATREHSFAATTVKFVNSKGEAKETKGMVLHDAREHQAFFPPDIAAFLMAMPDPAPTPTSSTRADPATPPTLPIPAIASGLAIVVFPGSIKIERDISDAYAGIPKSDARWAVPKALRFSPPSQVAVGGGPDGPIRVEAWLSNPTAHPIKVALWQVGYDNPFNIDLIEDAVVKPKPPDPNMPLQPPPMPPVPLPPIRIIVPAKTAIRFDGEMHIGGYDFKSGAVGKLDWSFHYWKAPEEKGTLAFKLP